MVLNFRVVVTGIATPFMTDQSMCVSIVRCTDRQNGTPRRKNIRKGRRCFDHRLSTNETSTYTSNRRTVLRKGRRLLL